MSETDEPAADAEGKTKSLNTKKIKRRMDALGSAEPKTQRKKRNKMALSILRQIAEGRIANPTAAAKAFLESKPQGGKDESEDATDD